MFEDQDKDLQEDNNAPSQPVEDMFGDVEPADGASGEPPENLPGVDSGLGNGAEVEAEAEAEVPENADSVNGDVGNISSAESAGVPESSQNPSPQIPSGNEQAVNPADLFPKDEPKKSSGGFGHVIQYVIIGLVIAGIIGLSAYFLVRFFSGQAISDMVNSDQDEVGQLQDNGDLEEETVPEPEPIPEPVLETEEIPETIPEPELESQLDTDGDGLSDAEEDSFGTDPTLIDTDADGLTDLQELREYFTDPLEQDSDGDGFIDGEEVQNGYSPTGPGRLFQVPS